MKDMPTIPSPGMKCPITQLREDRGMTLIALARALSVSYTELHRIEHGMMPRLRKGFRAKLDAAGLDSGKLSAEYEQWYETMRQTDLQKLRGGHDA